MKLQALYDLKERLEYVAIAGTGLLQEDFRLRRAVDALAPLAAANPVFAKISAASKALLAAPREERSARLADVLSLVNAVVYTQGVTDVPGQLEPLPRGGAVYVPLSYGQLRPLLDALSGSGSGRTSLIETCWKEHPEYFSDFRVLPYVVGALGDHYAELAELISAILLQQGAAVIPLLKEGFDPAGKLEMARRVRLIAKLAGNAENDWLVSILPDTKKDVWEAVIQALSLSRDNAQLLLDLCRSERGKLKETALRSLAMMGEPSCVEFLQTEFKKKPDLVACLKGVGTTIAADLAADAMQKRLEIFLEENETYDQKELETLVRLTDAVCGKYSPRMAQLWRWIAQHMDQFAAIVPDKNVRNCDFSVAEHLQKTFMQTILWNSEPEVLDLAKKLSVTNREWFLCCAFLADMAVVSAAQLYEKYAPLIVRAGILKQESKAEKNDRVQIMCALTAVNWRQDLRAYCVEFLRSDVMTGLPVRSCRKLDGLDERWITLLADPKVNEDGSVYLLCVADPRRYAGSSRKCLLSRMIDQNNPRVCTMIGNWFYEYTVKTGNVNESLYPLVCCGWKNWKGLLAHCARKNGEISWNLVSAVLRSISISNAEKAAELRLLDELALSKKVKIQFNFWPHEEVLHQIARLESAPNAEL